jgi:DNA-binding CsgD family transcriptional regulator
MPHDDGKIIRSLHEIYESAAHNSQDAWQAAYANLCGLVSAGPGSLHFLLKHELKVDALADTNTPGFVEEFNSKMLAQLPFRDQILGLKPGEHFLSSSQYPGDSFRNHPFYQEYFKKYGVFHVLHYCLFESDGAAAGITFARPEKMADFSAAEQSTLDEIVPHLQRAVRIHIELVKRQGLERIHLEALERIPQAVITVDETGQIITLTPSAMPLTEDDGVFVIEKNGTLSCTSQADTNSLRAVISGVFNPEKSKTNGFGGFIKLMTRNSHRPIAVAVFPFSQPGNIPGFNKRYAMLLISDPAGPLPDSTEQLRLLFSLTKREAEIAVLLAEGHSIAEISDLSATSLNTVRTHVKHVLHKVGANRQSGLVRIVLQLAGVRRVSTLFNLSLLLPAVL